MSFFFKILILSFFVSGYSLGNNERPIVLVSVPSYQAIVQEMVGENIDVQTLVPVGSNFHAFDPTPRRMAQLLQAKLWYTIGEPFEQRALEAFARSPQPPLVIDLRAGLCLMKSDDSHEGSDPHIWTSPRLMKQQLSTIRKGLIQAFPDLHDTVSSRSLTVERRCNDLIEQADKLLSGNEGKALVIAHGAYGYLCRDYGLLQLAIETGGKEVTLGSLDALITTAKAKHVKTVFALSQHPQQGIERVANILGAKVVLLNPFQPDYFQEEAFVIAAFSEALREET